MAKVRERTTTVSVPLELHLKLTTNIHLLTGYLQTSRARDDRPVPTLIPKWRRLALLLAISTMG